MKKITLFLVLVPLFLISVLNFTEGSPTFEHPPYLKGFTCSSCHATIVDGIIIDGKTDEDNAIINIYIELPDYIPFSAVQVDVKDVKNPKNANFPIYREDDYGTIYNTSIDKDLSGKKSNVLTFEIPMEEFKDGKEIEIQGLLTNGDGTNVGDFSFSEKIILEEKTGIQEVKEFQLFPTVAQSQITIKDAEENSLVSIIDISGKLVYQNVITSQVEIIDVSNFQNGYYFVNIDNSMTKIIVSK